MNEGKEKMKGRKKQNGKWKNINKIKRGKHKKEEWKEKR